MTSIITTASNIRFHKSITAAIAGAVFLFSSVPATAQISGVGSAVIDGTMSEGEWDGAATVNFDINLPGGGTTPGTLFVMNDVDDIYVAVRYARTFFDLPSNKLFIRIDADNDGSVTGISGVTIRPPDDEFFAFFAFPPPSASVFTDGFSVRTGWMGVSGLTCTGVCEFPDTLDTGSGTTDPDHPTVLGGAFINAGGFSVYEMVHPLDSADDDHDINVSAGDIIGISVIIRLGTTQTIFPLLSAIDPTLDVLIAEAGASRVLEFESLAHGAMTSVEVPSPYQEDGFTITGDFGEGTPNFSVFGSLDPRFTGSTALANGTVPATHTLTNDNNDPFTLVSIDVSEYLDAEGFSDGLLTYEGITTNAITELHSFTLDQPFGPQTIEFPATFSDLVSVSVFIDASGAQYHQIDNVVLEVQSGGAVPEAVDDFATADCGVDADIFVLANDNMLIDDPFVVIAQTTTDRGGTTDVNGSPSSDPASIFVTYTPPPGFDGTDTFDYTVTDENGTGESDMATVTVEVDGSSCQVNIGDQVIFNPDPVTGDQAVTAVVQEVFRAGTFSQFGDCSFDDDRGTGGGELDLLQKIRSTDTVGCNKMEDELVELEPTAAVLKTYQRAFEGEKIAVTLIKSFDTEGNLADLTRGVAVTEESASAQGVTEPTCDTPLVSDSPSTVGINLALIEPSGEKARNWTATCNRSRSIGHFSQHLLAYPIRNVSSFVPPIAQVHQEADNVRRAIEREQLSGCVDSDNKGRFLRVLKKDFNAAMRLVNKRRFDEAIIALNAVTVSAIAPTPNPYGTCPNDPEGLIASLVTDVTYMVHRGLLNPDVFVEFEIDADILAKLPEFPTVTPPPPPPIP